MCLFVSFLYPMCSTFCGWCNIMTFDIFVAAFSISTFARSFILPCSAHSASVRLVSLLILCFVSFPSYFLVFCFYGLHIFLVLSSFGASSSLIGKLKWHLACKNYCHNTSQKFSFGDWHKVRWLWKKSHLNRYQMCMIEIIDSQKSFTVDSTWLRTCNSNKIIHSF